MSLTTGAGSRVDVTLKLAQLQNFCKRDPQGYREDYDAQVRRLESECGILALSPSSNPSNRLVELIQFAAAVSSSSYKGDEANRIGTILIQLLLGSEHMEGKSHKALLSMSLPAAALSLHRDIRKACVSALILMRNKGAIEPLRLLELFFRILSVVPDKALRELLYSHIVNDIKNINKKGKRDEKVNRSIQSFLHRVVSMECDGEEATTTAQKRATDMVCELYRRAVWTDERCVAILASAASSTNTTVMSRAIRFFLNIEEKMAHDNKKEVEEEFSKSKVINIHKHSKKTKSRMRHVQRQEKLRTKAQMKKENPDWLEMEERGGLEHAKKLYPAIEMLHDPQGLSETLLKRLRGTTSTLKYETKLLMINFITRLVGNHRLSLLGLYPFLQRYMGGQQRDVTAILAYSVQACHELVPPNEIHGILKTIAHNFITERCTGEQMAVGVNAARAICARVPSVLAVENGLEDSVAFDIEAFARDLAAYSKHRDRSVMIAGKAWTNFIRQVHPGLLQGKHRGLAGTSLHRAGIKPLQFGEVQISSGVEGADLLAAYESRKAARKKNEENCSDSDGDMMSAEEGESHGDSEADHADHVIEKENASENSGDDDDDEQNSLEDDEEDDDENSQATSDGEEVEDEDENSQVETYEEEEEELSGDDEAPNLVLVEGNNDNENVLDISKMTKEEREKLKQEVSSTRIFSSADFARMKKLVDREERAKRDPRENARRKRALARGEDYGDLSDESQSENGDDDDPQIHIAGAVNPMDIAADAKRKRQSKAERLESILAGREKFESKARAGGRTNLENKRMKNFVMSKYSMEARHKRSGKTNLKRSKKEEKRYDDKKRRRKG
jgi:protein SDA1